MNNKLVRYGIYVWIVLNLLDLYFTMWVKDSSMVFFNMVETNPLIQLISYPNEFVWYKITLTVVMAVVLGIIGIKYPKWPLIVNSTFIVIWVFGIGLSYI